MLIDGRPLRAEAPLVHDLLRLGLEAKPDEDALVSSERRITWNELEEQATALAASYRALGLEKGDRVASLMPNRIDLVVHYLAVFKAGLVATPLNYRYTHREIDHALEVSAAKALLAHRERAEDIAASRLAGGLPLGVIVYGEGGFTGAHSFGGLLRAERPLTDVELSPPDPASPAAIFFTSGSTGPAKGVTHSGETLGWMVAHVIDGLELTPADAFLPGSSMSHIGSFMWTLASLAVGARVVVARSVDAHEVVPLLRDFKPTVLSMLPASMFALVRDHDLTAEDLSSLRLARAGADKVSTELLSEFEAVAHIQIEEGYGMTEVGLATNNPPSGTIKAGSIGLPVPGVSIAVRSEDGELAGPGNVGRIWISTPSRMIGYWEAPETTAEVVSGEWLDSGDLASADEEGYLWFFGRKKQVIVHDGSNISPLEVEGALLDHPAVALAGVVGVHDAVHGENVRAYVTIRSGQPRPTAADLIAHARERVGYKAPEEIVFLEEMPLNPAGKIDRTGLLEMAEDHLHPHGLE